MPMRIGMSIAFQKDMNGTNLEHDHTSEAIAKRLSKTRRHNYLRDFVYGAIDGTVTTFAVVSSVAGAGLNPEIVIVLGLANLFGDGFSMAAGNYLGTRTEQQLRDKAIAMEKRHIQLDPAGEREEIRQIFAAKGFEGADLDRVVEVITSDNSRWIDTMLVEEFGISLDGPSALLAATTTFVAFVVVGLFPLGAYIYGLVLPTESSWMFAISSVITAIVFFLIGTAKSYFVDQKWYWSGAETLLVGGIAASLAFFVGMLLKGISA